ncbi:MAG: Mu-like prophage major head subunit gpT family protein, partial [Burkholderiales bacterium]
LMAAHRNGYRGYSLRANLKEVLRTAVMPDVRAGAAGPSTYSIPNILSNVANKFALEGFYGVDNAWSSIASRRSVSDFKQITSLRPTGNLAYLRLAPGGEIEHGEVGERAYTNQAHTYARMIGISREDWINDDTGALGGTSREMGIGAADAVNNQFWTIFLNNAAFFAAGNNNVSAGVLNLANLAAADSVFRLQTKPNGRPLGLIPTTLLVPTALRITALNMMNQTTVVATNTAQTTVLSPAGNVLAGAFNVVSSPFMSNAAFTGNSAVAYYILAAPGQLSVIEGVFLNGVETPTVETADFDWNTLGTSMRGYIDFGFALMEFRGGVRSTGA